MHNCGDNLSTPGNGYATSTVDFITSATDTGRRCFLLAKNVLHPLDAVQMVEQIDQHSETLDEANDRIALEERISKKINDQGFAKAMAAKEEIAKKLDEIGAHTHALKVRECFCSGERHVFDSGRTVWYPEIREVQDHRGFWVDVGGCGLPKLCPFHGRIETRRRISKYLPHIEVTSHTHRIQFVTFTSLNAPRGHLSDCVRRTWDALRKLQRAKLWTADGSLATLETTYSPETGWNVHIHALVAVPYWRKGQRVDFDWAKIQKRWESLTGASVVDFKPVNVSQNLTGGLVETLKYVSKHDDLGDMETDVFAEWYSAFHGHRSLRSYGIWYGLQDIELDDADEAEEGEQLIGVLRWHWLADAKAVRVFLIQVNKSADRATTYRQIEAVCKVPRRKNKGSPPKERREVA